MRILICDDDPLAIEQIHKNLKSFFTYKHIKCPEVISYSCGEDLLNDTGNKDIVFLDIEMPGMNGIYVGNELKKSNPAVIIFIVFGTAAFFPQYAGCGQPLSYIHPFDTGGNQKRRPCHLCY